MSRQMQYCRWPATTTTCVLHYSFTRSCITPLLPPPPQHLPAVFDYATASYRPDPDGSFCVNLLVAHAQESWVQAVS